MKSIFRFLGPVLWCALIAPTGTSATLFTDSARANVMRQLDYNGTFVVTTANDSGLSRPGASIAGNGQVAYTLTFGGSQTAQQTFTLPSALTVGSYRVQFEDATRSASSFEILGRLGNTGAFTSLKTLTGGPYLAAEQAGTLDLSMQLTQIRFVATAPSSSGQFFLSEIEIFPVSTQPVSLYGGTSVPAMNLLRDVGRVTGTITSTNNAPNNFQAPGGGTAAVLVDGSYRHNEHVAINRNNAKREFVAYDLSGPTQLNYVWVGLNRDQGANQMWVWTSNLADPDEYDDADWFLQAYGSVAGGTANGQLFPLSQPGQWQHLRLTTFDSAENYGIVEVEAYGFIPEPSTALLLMLGGLVLRRSPQRRRAERHVKVSGSTNDPCQ